MPATTASGDGVDGRSPAGCGLSLWRRPWLTAWILAAGGAIHYFFGGMHFSPIEAGLFVLGSLALWLPLSGLFYHLLGDEIVDPLDRFTFATLASFSLTTLCYFGFVELHIGVLFYVIWAVLLVWFCAHVVKTKSWHIVLRWRQAIRRDRLNPTLALIVVGSLITCIKYNTYAHEQPDGSLLLTTFHDSTYHAGLAYELSRHIPPLQCPIRAGQPERAYHLFPQITMALIGRFTLQPDLMRANFVYRYTVIEILACLSLFCLGRWLSGRAGGGFLAASLMFIIVYPFPALVPSYLGYFFFAFDPHLSSFLEPIAVTSCQMFCAIPLVYAIALGLLIVGRQVRENGPVRWLPLLLGLMVAAEMRFRIQVFLPLVPGFLLLMAYFWIRSRKWAFALAIGACFLVVALLRLEMRSPAYLESSSELLFSYNWLGRSVDWMNFWPFHNELHAWLISRLGDNQTFNWTWQVVCMTAFVCLNICGIPTMIAIAVYLSRREAWRELLPMTVITFSLFLGSLAGGILLNTTYDPYSLGGEMLINVGIYGFPIYCLIAWWIVSRIWAMWSPAPVVARRVILAVLLIGIVAQFFYPATELRKSLYAQDRVNLSRATRGALAFLHDQTPPDSVVASVNFSTRQTAIYSGIGGRACYAEYLDSPVLDLLPGVIKTQTRLDRVARIWTAHSEADLRAALNATPIDYLVEYSDQPLGMRPASCLIRVWDGGNPDGSRVAVWKVLRPLGPW